MIKATLPTNLVADGGHVAAAPLVGVDRDEISQLVMRLKQADSRLRAPRTPSPAYVPSAVAVSWAEDWKLPREVHDYFILETRS